MSHKITDNFLAWCAEWLARHAKHNERVVSRQVVRRRGFELVLGRINAEYGGEPRKARRGIARTIARRTWKQNREAA
jgi:hypothetical protein